MVLTDLGNYIKVGGDNIKSRLAVLVLVIIASAFSIVYFLLWAPKDVVKPLNSTLICIVAVFSMLFAKIHDGLPADVGNISHTGRISGSGDRIAGIPGWRFARMHIHNHVDWNAHRRQLSGHIVVGDWRFCGRVRL